MLWSEKYSVSCQKVRVILGPGKVFSHLRNIFASKDVPAEILFPGEIIGCYTGNIMGTKRVAFEVEHYKLKDCALLPEIGQVFEYFAANSKH